MPQEEELPWRPLLLLTEPAAAWDGVGREEERRRTRRMGAWRRRRTGEGQVRMSCLESGGAGAVLVRAFMDCRPRARREGVGLA